MLLVRASRAVAAPMTVRLTSTSLLPPTRSYHRPRKGWLKPLTREPTEAAREMVARLQWNSALIGSTKRPKPCRDPMVAKAMKKAAATMNQP
jgi:hypothetical protein